MKQNISLIIGAIGISALILAGVLFLQSKNAGGPASIIDNAQFSFKTAIGKKAPDFTLLDMEGKQISLSGLSGKNVILFFNEGLMCYPACLDQVVELAKLDSADTVVYSVVVDSSEKWVNSNIFIVFT